MEELRGRRLKILIIQGGPASPDKERNVAAMASLLEEAVKESAPDFAVFCELATTPYFCATQSKEAFPWAEAVPGPTTQVFSALAFQHHVNIVLPLFERGPHNGEFYNSALLMDREGKLVAGRLPQGSEALTYRKCHLPAVHNYGPALNEKYFFRPGPGFPIFSVEGLRVGLLICYDRSFPESWRMLALQGAEVVFVVSSSASPNRAETFIYELRTAAVQNGLYIIAPNRGGTETFEGVELTFFGLSSVIDPFGRVMAQGPAEEGPALIRAELDLALLEEHATTYHYRRDRRPEIYPLVTGLP
ncbi:MAG: carbon-nitrogen hydrolase family protein [Chloroflexi bacterium]|nr:carbon-nitrogen hydrolase family protein [Chloroflexota bacterium]